MEWKGDYPRCCSLIDTGQSTQGTGPGSSHHRDYCPLATDTGLLVLATIWVAHRCPQSTHTRDHAEYVSFQPEITLTFGVGVGLRTGVVGLQQGGALVRARGAWCILCRQVMCVHKGPLLHHKYL